MQAAGDWKQEPNASGVSDMCLEYWKIGKRGLACVKVMGRLSRLMTPLETTCDIKIDYSEYKVKIIIGNVSEETGFSQFSQTVDFNRFYSESTANSFGLYAATFFAGALVTLF